MRQVGHQPARCQPRRSRPRPGLIQFQGLRPSQKGHRHEGQARFGSSITKPVVKATTLVTDDGVPIDAIHLPAPENRRDLAIVVAHGFTLSWQRADVWRVASRFSQAAGVISFDFRGHGRSGGLSTVGELEIFDMDVAVAWARELGYQRIAAVGFSMGASVVVRHAGLIGGLDAVVSVSGPGRWYYRGTKPMRWVHRAIEHRVGPLRDRRWLNTRISPNGWKPVPMPPAEPRPGSLRCPC